MEREPQEMAVLVGVNLNHQPQFDYSMEELHQLALACGIEVVDQITQNMSHVNRATYIGKGKIDEVRMAVDHHEANLVIFNDELSPSQLRNLERDLDVKIVDRTILILDIFARRARTKEAQLQVEAAHLQYMLPRLVGLRASYSRQGGDGGGVGLRNRGAGETKLELDRRRIEEKISFLERQMETLVGQRQIQRKRRKKNALPSVALVGYTNAGKSTVMNALVSAYQAEEGKLVLEKDMLFATLETSVRNIQLDDQKSFLLTDTVGFVSKLPHALVKAFRSTLEEVAEADLLIHVVDAANLNREQLIEITEKTLEEIGVREIPIIYAYNKSDLLDMSIPYTDGDRVYMSARDRVGLDELVAQIKAHIFMDYVKIRMLIPYSEGSLVSYFNEHAKVLAVHYEAEGTILEMECRQRDYEKYRHYEVAQLSP